MFLEPKTLDWRPSASFETLKTRAQILQRIRRFFDARGVLEVETPLLAPTTATDPYIQSFSFSKKGKENYYLQTSPEYYMKRLLAAGSGDIYQISKAFRDEEMGRLHQPEFTLLEWYRIDFNHHDLMDEMNVFLKMILKCKEAERVTYHSLFEKYCQMNPHEATIQQLQQVAKKNNLFLIEGDYDTWLMYLFMHLIEPHLGKDQPTFVYDFPASQAALSKIEGDHLKVASRFEVYIQGIELANGFYELQDPNEQSIRFMQDLKKREACNLPILPIDSHLLAALQHGLPRCAGVALGIDRLLMIAMNKKKIKEVISFFP